MAMLFRILELAKAGRSPSEKQTHAPRVMDSVPRLGEFCFGASFLLGHAGWRVTSDDRVFAPSLRNDCHDVW